MVERLNEIKNSPSRHGQWDFHSRLSKKERYVKEGERRTNWNGRENVRLDPEEERPRSLGSEPKILLRKIKHTERLVSLYFTLMSAAVRRMASIASSKVTLYTPSLAMESWAAVIALTAIADRIKSD